MSGFPIVSDADFSDQRNVEFGHRVHDLRKVFFHQVNFVFRHFHDQFVMNLENQFTLESLLFNPFLNGNHGKLDQVSCRALHRRVNRSSFSRGTTSAARMNLRKPQSSAESRLNIALAIG